VDRRVRRSPASSERALPPPVIEWDGDSAEGPSDWEAVHRHGGEEADHDGTQGAAVWQQHLDVAAGPM
jgi:hypothetical protein